MCLAVPGKVMALDGSTARVMFGGVERKVQTDLLPDVQVGEFVLVHAGYAIQRMDAEEAAETIALLRQLDPSLGLEEPGAGKP